MTLTGALASASDLRLFKIILNTLTLTVYLLCCALAISTGIILFQYLSDMVNFFLNEIKAVSKILSLF